MAHALSTPAGEILHRGAKYIEGWHRGAWAGHGHRSVGTRLWQGQRRQRDKNGEAGGCSLRAPSCGCRRRMQLPTTRSPATGGLLEGVSRSHTGLGGSLQGSFPRLTLSFPLPVSFFGDSFVEMPLADASRTVRLRLQLYTGQGSGLLFLAAGQPDHLLLQLRAGTLQVSPVGRAPAAWGGAGGVGRGMDEQRALEKLRVPPVAAPSPPQTKPSRGVGRDEDRRTISSCGYGAGIHQRK